jgi:hypothetical protein
MNTSKIESHASEMEGRALRARQCGVASKFDYEHEHEHD